MNGELKACPFCGADAHLIRHGDTKRLSIRCCKCGADVGEFDTEAEVREHWNRRPTPAPGALPELPQTRWNLGGLPLFDGGQMHAYARAYAEQRRAGVEWHGAEVRPRQDAMLALFIGSPSDGGPEIRQGRFDAPFGFIDSTTAMRIDPDAWTYAPPALQSAFADDEGVKNGR